MCRVPPNQDYDLITSDIGPCSSIKVDVIKYKFYKQEMGAKVTMLETSASS